MCYVCYVRYGQPAVVTEKTLAAAAAIRRVYDFDCSGGAAHIVVADWTLEDHHITWCMDVALHQHQERRSEEEIAATRACLEALQALTLAERATALALHDGIISGLAR